MSISTLHLDASDSMAQQWPHARGEEGRGGGQGRDRTCPGALHPGHSLTGLPSVSAYQSMHVEAHQLTLTSVVNQVKIQSLSLCVSNDVHSVQRLRPV